jgi:hypothetical protein
VLVEQHEAFGHTLCDIKGIDPSVATHKIPSDENAKPFVDTQKRFNSTIKQVVIK